MVTCVDVSTFPHNALAADPEKHSNKTTNDRDGIRWKLTIHAKHPKKAKEPTSNQQGSDLPHAPRKMLYLLVPHVH